MKKVFALAIIAAALVAASPANDWSRPCFDGECAYDLPSSSGSGALKIFGSSKSVTDITPAAGWVVLECDSNALAQDIRLVCNGDDAGCNHMFDHDGPSGKLVRLPESCGRAPFARIASASVADNQSVPSHLTRRDGTIPQVHTLTVDDNFAAIDHEKFGEINFALVAGNFAGISFPSESEYSLSARDLDVEDGKKDGKKGDKKDGKKGDKKDGKKGDKDDDDKKGGKKGDKKGKKGDKDDDDKKGDKKGKKGDKDDDDKKGGKKGKKGDKDDDDKKGGNAKGNKKEWFQIAIQKIKKSKAEVKEEDTKNSNSFSIEHKKAFQPTTLNKNDVLYTITKQCPASATYKSSVEGKAKFDITLGVAATGSLSPAKIEDFALMIGANIDIDGKIVIDSDIIGDYEGKERPLVAKQGVNVLNIPSVFKFAPAVTLFTSIKSELDLPIDYAAEVNYDLDDIEFWYPPSVAKSFEKSGKAVALDTSYSISASPDAEGDVSVDFRLRPLIEVDVTGFGQSATVFVEANSGVSLDLDGDADDGKKAAGGKKDDDDDKKGKKGGKKDDDDDDKKKGGKKGGKKDDDDDDKKGGKKGGKKDDDGKKKGGKKGKKDAELLERSIPPYGTQARSLVSRGAKGQFDGCAVIKTDIDINGGSSGKFFDLFKGNNKVDILDRHGELLNKCFGDSEGKGKKAVGKAGKKAGKKGDDKDDDKKDGKKGGKKGDKKDKKGKKGKRDAQSPLLDPFTCPKPTVGKPVLISKEVVKSKKILN